MMQGMAALLQQMGDNNAEEKIELTGEQKAAAIRAEDKMQLLRK